MGWLETRSAAFTCAAWLWLAGLTGCYKEERVLDSTGAHSTNSDDGMECAGFETTTEVSAKNINSVDLLFVIDNSASMRTRRTRCANSSRT